MSSLFNFDTNHTKTPADMAGTRSQSKNHKKTHTKRLLLEEITKKMKKRTKTSKILQPRRDHVTCRVTSTPHRMLTAMTLTKLRKKLLPPKTLTKMKLISLTLTKQTLMNGRLSNWHKDTPSLSMLTTAKETIFLRRKNTLKTCSHHAIHC